MTTRPLFRKALSEPRPAAAGVALAATAALIGWLAASDGHFMHRAWPLLVGALFGIALQRSELSFVRAWRDVLVMRDSDQMLGFAACVTVASALTLGGMLVLGAAVPPAGARIAPVSPILPVSAFAFGVGAVIARGSLMVHLRRFGEGSLVAVPALLATFAGFVLAMVMWPWAYDHALARAPSPWLPATLGVGGALGVELAVLALATAALLRLRPPHHDCGHGRWTRLTVDPWPAAPAGALIGILAALSYAAGEPIGLASEGAAFARWLATSLGLVPVAMPGLDEGIGGLVVPLRFLSFSGHLVIVTGVLLGSFAAALASGHFKVVGMTPREAAEMAVGGLLIGWGGMLGLGTVTGAVVSGIAVGALSGWVFLVFVSLGVVLGLKFDRRAVMTAPEPVPS